MELTEREKELLAKPRGTHTNDEKIELIALGHRLLDEVDELLKYARSQHERVTSH